MLEWQKQALPSTQRWSTLCISVLCLKSILRSVSKWHMKHKQQQWGHLTQSLLITGLFIVVFLYGVQFTVTDDWKLIENDSWFTKTQRNNPTLCKIRTYVQAHKHTHTHKHTHKHTHTRLLSAACSVLMWSGFQGCSSWLCDHTFYTSIRGTLL